MTVLREFLSYYKSLSEPMYAVLVTGAWGTGKTYQVHKCFDKEEYVYVSLFGLKSSEDIQASILSAMDPSLRKVKSIVSDMGGASKDVGGFFAVGGLLSKIVSSALNERITSSKVLVLDDLERCNVPFKEMLGIINNYVEHQKCKVVILSHDKKIQKKLKNAKEKIIGQTIKITPEVDEAFDAFVKDLSLEDSKKFLKLNKKTIIDIFTASNCRSLRILRHVIFDLGRLEKILDKSHKKNADAMAELVRLFSALDIEVRMGELGEVDIEKRKDASMVHYLNVRNKGDSAPVSPIVRADRKYTNCSLESRILDDHTIINMLFYGLYNSDDVKESISNSSYFIQAKSAPPWEVVLKFDELDDVAVSSAINRLQRQFEERSVEESGEMLHMFSLRFLMVDIGVSESSFDDVQAGCISYIDDLHKSGRLPAGSLSENWYKAFYESHRHYSYFVLDSYRKNFNHVRNYLIKRREEVYKNKLPDRAKYLLSVLEESGEKFYRQICYTSEGEGEYADIPILSYIKPKSLVASWLASPVPQWDWISRGLRYRYERNPIGKNLYTEKEWVAKIVAELDKEADRLQGFRGLRIKRATPQILREIAKDVDASSISKGKK